MPLNLSPLLLWNIFFLIGYLAFFASVRQDLPRRRTLPALALAVLLVYLCAAAFTVLLYHSFGADLMILYLLQVFYAAAAGIYLAGLLWRSRSQMKQQPLLWLAVDLVSVLYITLGSRLLEPRSAGVRMIPFQNLLEALEWGSVQPLEDFILNIILFVPTGLLLAHLGPNRLRRIGLGFLAGLVLSTAIETVQLIAHLGLCDVNDIISNALGAALGVLCHNIIFPRWKQPRT